jgi:cell division septal protein FtsQ
MLEEKNSLKTSRESSWKSLSQQLSGPAITPIAQKRRRFILQKRIFIIVGVVFILCALTFAGFYLYTNSRTIAPYAEEQSRTKIVFFSDGQLTMSWFADHFGALKKKDLLSIDIANLQATLLKNPQILEATIDRHFPNVLKVTLRERAPIGRVKLKFQGKVEVYYLARDGELFASPAYRPPATLPFLGGLNLREVEGQLPTVVGAANLADLLDGLKAEFPDLFMQISSIDMSDWIFPVSPQTSILLSFRDGMKLRFGPQKINDQLARLKETFVLIAQEKQSPSKKIIDLTYPDKVAIVDKP